MNNAVQLEGSSDINDYERTWGNMVEVDQMSNSTDSGSISATLQGLDKDVINPMTGMEDMYLVQTRYQKPRNSGNPTGLETTRLSSGYASFPDDDRMKQLHQKGTTARICTPKSIDNGGHSASVVWVDISLASYA